MIFVTTLILSCTFDYVGFPLSLVLSNIHALGNGLSRPIDMLRNMECKTRSVNMYSIQGPQSSEFRDLWDE